MRYRHLLLALAVSLQAPAFAQTVSMSSKALRLAPVSANRAAFVATSRTSKGLAVGVLSDFNCDTVPAEPRVLEFRDAVTISVESRPVSDAAPMATLCVRELRFVIEGLLSGHKTVYYVQDDHVLGHAAAP